MNILNWFRRKREATPFSSLYAKAGEVITCESGHEICTIGRNIYKGATQIMEDLINWRQQEPKIGCNIPVCAICGADFYVSNIFPPYGGVKVPNNQKFESGIHMHFQDGWR